MANMVGDRKFMEEEMTEKEAREAIKHYRQLDTSRAIISAEPHYMAAQGYLEAIEKAKGLEKGIKEAINKLGGPTMEYESSIANEEKGKNIESGVRILIQALAKFKEEK